MAQAAIGLGVVPHTRSPPSPSLGSITGRAIAVRSRRRARSSGRMSAVVAKFELPPLPYEMNALEPFMSKTTLEFHWGKHQRAYIDNLNKQISGTELESLKLEDIITKTYGGGNAQPSFNNAAQAWNHDFFFHSMTAKGGKAPSGDISGLINRDLGSYDNFVKEFKTAATTQFGSGWAWLSLKDGKLIVQKTANAVNPLVSGETPLLVLDVWEHAYYLDFQNRRPDYVETFLRELVNWDTVNARLETATAKL
ncbi:superoxide dismutase [Fe], chloroplastic isoform X2 [Selaginella moellendorffii]|nr:superoxide dismutase [Fe], chloroplastic isoform X2 [Selaginella moellendorffii]|eukprot:XP_002986085.2 superoxide dismutase [Fe], chloroplastic isoform X2 [Selaginella moellendorffii]